MTFVAQAYGTDTAQSGGRGSPNAWSPASDTQNWTQAAGTATLSVVADSGRNRLKLTNDTVANVLYLGARQFTDVDVFCRINVSNTAVRPSVIARATATNTYYRADVTGTTFEIVLNNGGVNTSLAAIVVTFTAATYYWIHFRVQGFGTSNGSNPNNLKANFWADPTAGASTGPTGEPAGWMLQTFDNTLTNPGNFGVNYKATGAAQFAYYDAFTCTDAPPPDNAPAYNTVGNRPYGITLYIPNTNTPPLPDQTIIDLIGNVPMGSNPISTNGWGKGANLRYNARWSNFEPVQGFYDWGILDDAVQKANYYGFRITWPIQAPPTWWLTRDGLGNNCTLNASNDVGGQYTHNGGGGSGYTTINVTGLPRGAYVPHLAQITIDYGAGTAEPVWIWNPGATYTQGVIHLGISTSKNSQVAWNPVNTHNAGEQIWQGDSTASPPTGGPQFARGADFATFAGIVAKRYNGTNGFGRMDAFQVENENYDASSRVGLQGPYNTGNNSPPTWDKSSTWDNGGAILAPVYVAARNAIKAVYPTCPVFSCAVRRAPNTGRQHIQNWMTGFVTQVLAQGGTIDGVDFHFYRGNAANWDGTLINDPTQSTYTDASLTVINAPSVAVEIADITAILTSNGLNPLIMNGETGWPIYDDGNGPLTTLSAARNSGTPYTTLAVNAGWTNGAAIPDGTAITVDYNNVANSEIVYAYGQAAKNATTIQITTNSAGSGQAQAAWTPAHTHAISAQVYGSTTTVVVTTAQQSTYLKSMYDAGRLGGADYCFVFTLWYNPTVTTTTNPQWSTSPDSITQNPGSYTYEPAYSMTVTDSATYPTWVGATLTTPHTYTVTVGGQAVFVVTGTLLIDSAIGRRSTASFIVHSSIATHFQQYQTVNIFDLNNTLVFSGYITNPKETKPGFQPSLLTQITCCDQHFLADKRVMAATYTNRTCGEIVQDIRNTVLSSEGVTVGQIYDGIPPATTLYPLTTLYPGGNVGLVPSAIFAYCSVAQALDALATEASAAGIPYYWQIDQNKKLWFVPYTSVVNSNAVDGTHIDQVYKPPSVIRANPTYRNTQYIVGGVAQTVTQTENRLGDGNATSWAMSFDLATTPTVSTNLNGAGYVTKTVGIRGVDTGKDFYWQQGSPDISQDSGGAVLRGSPFNDLLKVVYIGQYPTVVIDQNNAQITFEAANDNTSGIIEQVETDATITSISNGLAKASALLTRYAAQGTILEFTTLVSGYAQGQLITVNLPMFGLNSAQMLIEEVSASDQRDGYNIWYTVKAVLGPYDTSWVAFFSTLLAFSQPANSINVGVSRSITILATGTITLAPTITGTATVFACPIPNTTLDPSTTLFPC